MICCMNTVWHGSDQPVVLLSVQEAQIALIVTSAICLVGSCVSTLVYSLWSNQFRDQSLDQKCEH